MLGSIGRRRFGLMTSFVVPVLLATGGCTLPDEELSQVTTHHEPHAQVVQYRHTVIFPDGDGRLDPAERERLDEFLAQTDPGEGDAVFVAAAQGDPQLAERRRGIVSAYLEMRDVEARAVSANAIAEPPAGESVDVIVDRYVVTLPGCPDWTDPARLDWTNAHTRNWGCATAVNFGMMVANPHDLEVGREPGPMDGEVAARSIYRYRAGKTESLKPIDVTVSSGGGGSGGN